MTRRQQLAMYLDGQVLNWEWRLLPFVKDQQVLYCIVLKNSTSGLCKLLIIFKDCFFWFLVVRVVVLIFTRSMPFLTPLSYLTYIQPGAGTYLSFLHNRYQFSHRYNSKFWWKLNNSSSARLNLLFLFWPCHILQNADFLSQSSVVSDFKWD